MCVRNLTWGAARAATALIMDGKVALVLLSLSCIISDARVLERILLEDAVEGVSIYVIWC